MKQWKGLQSLIKIERTANIKEKETGEIAYFISSLPATISARKISKGIRSHWSIENSLHYVKDVTFKEDASRIRTGNAPENISIIKSFVLNIFRKNGFTNMARAVRLVSHDISRMWEMLA